MNQYYLLNLLTFLKADTEFQFDPFIQTSQFSIHLKLKLYLNEAYKVAAQKNLTSLAFIQYLLEVGLLIETLFCILFHHQMLLKDYLPPCAKTLLNAS